MFSQKFSAFALFVASFATVQAFQGDATYYYPNGGIGACGAPMQNSDLIVALNPNQWEGGSHCWKHIGVWYGNNFVDATVGDLCPGCGDQGIDLSPAAFERLASLDAGRISVGWAWE